jgi:hypothetical protein
MKQRLQYKNVSAGNGHDEQSPLQSVPPLHDVHPIAFEPAETVDCPSVEEEIPGVESNVASKKPKVHDNKFASTYRFLFIFLFFACIWWVCCDVKFIFDAGQLIQPFFSNEGCEGLQGNDEQAAYLDQ